MILKSTYLFFRFQSEPCTRHDNEPQNVSQPTLVHKADSERLLDTSIKAKSGKLGAVRGSVKTPEFVRISEDDGVKNKEVIQESNAPLRNSSVDKSQISTRLGMGTSSNIKLMSFNQGWTLLFRENRLCQHFLCLCKVTI